MAQDVDMFIRHLPLHRDRIDLARSEISSSLRCCTKYDSVHGSQRNLRHEQVGYEEEKWGLS